MIGRYTIVDRLGRGGMGVVYHARDNRLERDVALKFLNPHRGNDEDAEACLLAEARAAAALQHPNICVVHEIGQTVDGRPFIAMAHCEGVTLKERLAAGAVDLGTAVTVALQLARALDAAHTRQIIHRDVKPGNIIVAADGTVKLLDFGLARSSDVPVTQSGLTPGTVAYMSPEQTRGEPLDNRSDLWSLGVVLYEMLAGRRPFRGGSDRVILQSILHDEPESVQSVGPHVPAHVARVVDRLLRKNRDTRYGSAAEVVADLTDVPGGDGAHSVSMAKPHRTMLRKMLAGAGVVSLLILLGLFGRSGQHAARSSTVATAAGAEPSLAVLPLVHLSADSSDAVLAAGITDELISTLSRAGGVRVIASTSTSGFKDRAMDVRTIADSLGVANILEGGVQKRGSQVRVELRLISARDGSTKWSQAYDRAFTDMFVVQDEIVRAVAAELGLRFDRDRQLRRHRARSVAAYELYLRGSDPVLLRSQGGIWKALGYFEQAIAIDSTYAAAYAGLALVHVRRGRATSNAGTPLHEIFALAERSAETAITLDDSLAEAHYALSRVREAMLDFSSAESELQRAIALDPARSVYHRSMATLHGWARRPDQELAEARLALETDPLNPYAHVALGGALAANRRYDEALNELGLVAAMKPPLQVVPFVIAECYAKQGRIAEAIAILRPQADAGDPMFRGMLGYMLARDGQRDEAQRLLADLIAVARRTKAGAFQVAMIHAGLGNMDDTFVWLHRSIDDWSLGSVIMGPIFDDLHRDPRFQQLTDRLGLASRL